MQFLIFEMCEKAYKTYGFSRVDRCRKAHQKYLINPVENQWKSMPEVTFDQKTIGIRFVFLW